MNERARAGAETQIMPILGLPAKTTTALPTIWRSSPAKRKNERFREDNQHACKDVSWRPALGSAPGQQNRLLELYPRPMG